nr:1083_t:CDS:2 [Entrophospora candida]
MFECRGLNLNTFTGPDLAAGIDISLAASSESTGITFLKHITT